MININWNNIRPIGNSLNDGFEELVRQLAGRENIDGKYKFVPLGKPDAGVECFWILENGDEWGWQAKYFTASLSQTQWNEINDSVRTAIDKHPKLKKYIIALPIDPPDARLKKQKSLLQKWDDRVMEWGKWASNKGLTVDFEPWWSSDLISRLVKPENAGLTYRFFNKEEFTDEWCKEQTELSITELGKRYTPELNVKLEVSKIFDGIARDEKFDKQISALFDDFFTKDKQINIHDEELNTKGSEFKNKIHELYQLFLGCEFRGVENIPYTKVEILLDAISKLSEHLRDYYLKIEQEIQDKKKEYGYYQKYGSELHSLREFNHSLEMVRSFISSPTAKLSINPILLLDGEAGIGKSHLLADIVESRNLEDKPSLFFLGQDFPTTEDPWTQIFKRLHLKCSVDEFLGALNSKAESKRSRIILFVDALNEGQGKYFWSTNIKSFIRKIKKYQWLGLVLSVRTSYKKLIFPPDELPDDLIISYTHYGFRDVEYEATKLFFGAYKIQLPNVPLLHPEFQNPLFLKLFCEGLHKSGYAKIPDGVQGITSVIEFFIKSINLRLSRPERLEYPSSVNVVKKAIGLLISEKINKKLRYIPYEAAFLLVDNLLREFSTNKGLLDELISEGVLSKNLFWESDKNYEEGVYLAYERFEDHLTADFLLNNISDLEYAFSPKGELFHYVQDEHACYINKGLIEAFAIQLPEKTGKELYEYVVHIKDTYPIVEAFVQSLLWRRLDTTSEKSREYVNSSVFSYQGTYDLFWEIILSVTAIPNHYFNAYSLHRHLMKFSLADRDAGWTVYLKDKFPDDSAVTRLVDWAWSEQSKDYILDESIKLAATTLSWFQTSTHRELRDSATKALICLLMNKIYVLIDVLKEFKDVNDPYIYERLLAVAYGCSLRTKQKEVLPDLSHYIYHAIFDSDGEIYPHILLRDYARGVIEYTSYLGYDLNIDMNKVRPPYKSFLRKKFPTNEEIDKKYRFDYKSQDFKDYFWGQNDILSSMTTEYGRGTGGYGDFGRYVFQRALSRWNVDENALSNLAIQWIFEKYGYDVKKHGKFDREIGSGRWKKSESHERIGKKYQWLTFYEILAKVSDNFKKYDETSYRHKKLEPYEGPWNPYVRDIDPTLLIKNMGSFEKDESTNYWWINENYSNWDSSNDDWLKQADDLPDSCNLINVVDEKNEEWLVLEGYPRWLEPKALGNDKWSMPRKQMWYQIRSYLVKSKDYENLKNWAIHQDFIGRWMPEGPSRYEMFSREYYWSTAHEFFQREYFGGQKWKKVSEQRNNDTVIAKVMTTCESFTWEEELDYSKKETIRFLKPCVDIYEQMNLRYSDREGEFINQKNEVICFDPSVYYPCDSLLLIKKTPMMEYLNKNDLQIIWTILGEKNIAGGNSYLRKDMRWLEINGVYSLQKGVLDGKITAKSA
jgi:hypothetical protein